MKISKKFIKRPTAVSGGRFENRIEIYEYKYDQEEKKINLEVEQPLIDLEDEETLNGIYAEIEERKRKQREEIEKNNKLYKKRMEKMRQLEEERHKTQRFFSYSDQKSTDTKE